MSDIQLLFQRDPLSLTKDDPALDELIKYYREKRAQFNLGDKTAGSAKKLKAKASADDVSAIDEILKGI